MSERWEDVTGADLRVGDTIEVWWRPRRDTITELREYTGRLRHLWKRGARLASFGICKSGMTCGNDEDFKRIVRGGG